MVSLYLLLACGGAPTTIPDATVPDDTTPDAPDETPSDGTVSEDPDADATVVLMGAVDLLTRASLDLRGVRPTIAEIEAVEADPALVDAYIEEFLYDGAFGERVRSLFSEIYLTQTDYYYLGANDYGMDDEAAFASSVGQEPLRILSRIAEEDRPYTEIVTADWTMSNDILATAWELEAVADTTRSADYYSEADNDWYPAQYTDGRPAAGILSTNAMWWRYTTTTSNANRGRANAISKILLCTDYLSEEISFDRNVNLLDGDAVNDALQNNPGCVACHYSLDPLASYLWGFYYNDLYSKRDSSIYHPEREYLWESYTGVQPSYYGEPGYTLADLGVQLAGDPKLAECAVEQVFSLLNQRSIALDDTDFLTGVRETFLDEGLTLRPVFREVMAGPQYRAAPTDDELYTSRKMVSADQLASQVEDITGFRYTYYGYDMLQTDAYGLRTLAGGVDGTFVTSPASEPTATMVLVHERLAQAAANYVVEQDKANPSEARLFTEISFSETPASDRDAMVAQIQQLHLRLFGDRVAADGPEVEANMGLWEDLYDAEGSVTSAWVGLLSVLMRDPEFLFY